MKFCGCILLSLIRLFSMQYCAVCYVWWNYSPNRFFSHGQLLHRLIMGATFPKYKTLWVFSSDSPKSTQNINNTLFTTQSILERFLNDFTFKITCKSCLCNDFTIFKVTSKITTGEVSAIIISMTMFLPKKSF